MKLTPADIAITRELVTYARANGWDHIVYGGSFGVEHVWRKRGASYRYGAKVTWCDDKVEYFEPDNRQVKATLTPATAAEARDWLRLLRLLPSVAEFAEALLTDVEHPCSCGGTDPVHAATGDPDWYIAQQAQDVMWHREGAS